MLTSNVPDRPIARATDPHTSHEAAESLTTRELIESFVLSLFHRYGAMTDAELTDRYFSEVGPAAHIDSPRKRRSDLADKGRLRPSNLTRLSPTGRKAIVWEVVK